jgi:GH25 family lysozyme M1 (1,4-beta-N-acetylmuramidase)
MPVAGIDVSKWQGEIDWQKAKNAGAQFAIIMGWAARM